MRDLQRENEDKLQAYLEEKRATYQVKEKTIVTLKARAEEIDAAIARLQDQLEQLHPVIVVYS